MRLLNHPNIVPYIDQFDDDKNSCVAMEYSDGGELKQILENGVADELTGVMILYQLLLALKKIHQKKIVNKNIKTDDIFLDAEGNAKLADFKNLQRS